MFSSLVRTITRWLLIGVFALCVALAPIGESLAAPPAAPALAVAAAVAPAGIYYPLLDEQGSLRALTTSTGTVVLRQNYDAWGAVRQRSGDTSLTTLGWAGERSGTADGLSWLRARHYAPGLGRFLQRDTFAGAPGTPQSLNRYAGLEGNPVNMTDPSGHIAIADDAVLLVGVAIVWVAGGLLIVINSKQQTSKGQKAVVQRTNSIANELSRKGVAYNVSQLGNNRVLAIGNGGKNDRALRAIARQQMGISAGASPGGGGKKPKKPKDQWTRADKLTLAIFIGHPIMFIAGGIACEQVQICGAGRNIGTDAERAAINEANRQLITDYNALLHDPAVINAEAFDDEARRITRYLQDATGRRPSDLEVVLHMLSNPKLNNLYNRSADTYNQRQRVINTGREAFIPHRPLLLKK